MTVAVPAKLPTQLFHAGHHWSVYQHISAAGISPEQVTHPAYWQHVAASLRRRDVIEIVAEDGAFEVRMRVINAMKGALTFRVIGVIGDPLLDEPAQTQEGGLIVNHAPKHGWRVVDEITKEVIAKGFAEKAEAEAARDNILHARQAA